MALYTYRKIKPRPFKKLFSAVSVFFMISGISLIAWVAYPIVSFELFFAPRFVGIIKPIPEEVIAEALENRFPEALSSTRVDYTKANVWFPKKPQLRTSSVVEDYNLSIPKLKIKDASVIIGSEDLNKSLIHYGGTATPGDYGNAVIFGHSVLPAFYDPKNYKTIFSTLPTLTNGDDIYLNYDNVTYKYTVEEMRVVSPDDISVLEQKFDDSYISLITCVPPGTYWKRLVVKARLAKI
ncbi:MAG: sortase family protein [Candidatus Gottesmanbacteria bacterium GW2011_GWA2_41_12]|uniref:Sortase family protein n=2 Tax=Candidatus Gottesmaniibacteriota TaxID=1752720 RepID=A0A0G0UHV0_9BACT|nr:MAG: sortase family protein [Candidatus Gottesmanbacteria bacterium GW2011_GWC2_39_8]KKR88409.1 MAG: sortase family protein [Candidatus Gottesmanbacteria bacterium GW2011_GWA2_41_12]